MITLRIEFAPGREGGYEDRCINIRKGKIEHKENRKSSKGKARKEDAKDVDRRKRRWNVLAGRAGKEGKSRRGMEKCHSTRHTHTHIHMCA